MKSALQFRCLLPALWLFLAFQLHADGITTPNTAAPTWESWQTISNRWGAATRENIRQAADKTDVSAQYYLAVAYMQGNGVGKDPEQAFKWMQLAANAGKPQAQRLLGLMFKNGQGTATDASAAFQWLDKAAQSGDASAQLNLGRMYENGIGVPLDYAEAAKYYRQAAEQGLSVAQNNLGWFYFRGRGVPQDAAEALQWYQKSAAQGEPIAEQNLAWMYAQGAYGKGAVHGQGADWQIRSGGIAPNHELAEKWMRQAVDLTTAEGQCQFANLVFHEVDNAGHQDTNSFPLAAHWFQKAAELGYAEAQYQLAEMYHTGKLGDDYRTNCLPWLLKAAAQGNIGAKAEVAKLPQ